MANIELWIQVENHTWDLAPGHLDRLTGHHFPHVPMTLRSPVTGKVRNPNMHKPLGEEALILRRYTSNWAAPDDRKVNPWDLNELDPTDNGTMGTIPGPVIECNVGDSVTVHFRNFDTRSGKTVEERTHSLHPHGFVFEPTSDGAYPLSPPDPAQPVGAEKPLWDTVGVETLKKGDWVPPPLGSRRSGHAARWHLHLHLEHPPMAVHGRGVAVPRPLDLRLDQRRPGRHRNHRDP